ALAPDAEALAVARSRVASAPDDVRELLVVVALARTPLPLATLTLVAGKKGENQKKRVQIRKPSVATALALGLLVERESGLALAEPSFGDVVCEGRGPDESRAMLA